MDNHASIVLAAVAAGSTAALAWLLVKQNHASNRGLTPCRDNYCALKRSQLPSDGRDLFLAWSREAELKDGVSARVMVVATSTPDEGPTVRSVIFHKMNEDGSVVFGTNATSQKCRALRVEPRCELLFRWGDRQIRIRGRARIAGEGLESDAAFERLPRHCQLGLQVLAQGTAINEDDHAASITSYSQQIAKFGMDRTTGSPVPRPANYTAVVVMPETFEFYQGGHPGYINDRFIFGRTKSKEVPSEGFPLLTRLQA